VTRRHNKALQLTGPALRIFETSRSLQPARQVNAVVRPLERMPFPLDVRLRALVACQRHCCLCHERKHTRLQCHHIVQEADGGSNAFENCIPLCPDCHAEVKAFNPRHPFGATPYHGDELIRRRDDWYAVVARRSHDLATRLHRVPTRYPANEPMSGRAAFDYSSHDGFFRIGTGNCEFLTHWSKASDISIHCYSDSTNLVLAIAPAGTELGSITDASLLDYTSRVRTPRIGQVVVFENHVSRYAAARIARIEDNTRGASRDWLEFDFWILDDGSDDFSQVA
jgi:hypothetical protein